MLLAPVIYSFGARCPRGHLPSQQLSVAELNRADVEFYCVLCDLAWIPSLDERARVRAFVASGSRSFQPAEGFAVAVVRLICEHCAADVSIHCHPQGLVDVGATSLIECPDCAHPTDVVLPGPVLDVFRA